MTLTAADYYRIAAAHRLAASTEAEQRGDTAGADLNRTHAAQDQALAAELTR